MQPKLKIIQVPQGDQVVDALEITPVVMPDGRDAKGAPVKQNAPTMPLAPVVYPLVDEDTARLVKLVMRSSQPIKSGLSIVEYGRLDAAAVKSIMATIGKLNGELLPLAGTGIVADPVGSDAFTFSIRHTAEMWGGRTGQDLMESATFRAGHAYAAPAPKAAPVKAVTVTEPPIKELPRFVPPPPPVRMAAPPGAMLPPKPAEVIEDAPVVALPIPQLTAGATVTTKGRHNNLRLKNLPALMIARDLRTGNAVLHVDPKAHHTNQPHVEVAIPSGMVQAMILRMIESPASIVDANTLPFLGVPHAELKRVLAEINVGLSLAGMCLVECSALVTNSGLAKPRLKFTYDQSKWGAVPADFAMAGTTTQGVLPGVEISDAERANGWARRRARLATKKEREAAASVKPRVGRSVRPLPPLLQIMIDETGPAPKLEIDTVQIDVTAREVKLLKAARGGRMSPVVYLDNLQEPITREPGEDHMKARQRCMIAIRTELKALDARLVAAARRSPRAQHKRFKAPNRIIGYGSDIFIQKVQLSARAPA